jgi:Ca-activated chloride channel family protein
MHVSHVNQLPGDVMRSVLRAVLVLTAFGAPVGVASAQGMLLPPCGRQPLPPDAQRRILPCPAVSQIVRTQTDVHATLAGRVIQYEVQERFVNRGNTVGEADYVYPLPKNSAFQDLQLEINGEFVAGETFGADEARRMYEEIVRKRRDPALVEWMGHGLLRARIFPIAPGEEKRVVIRFQSVAEREGDALKIDYFGGGGTAQGAAQSSSTPVHFTLTYPRGGGLLPAYSPTNEIDSHDRGDNTEVVVRGDARDVTLLVPVAKANAPAISVLTNAPGHEDGFAMITVAPPDRGSNDAGSPRDITLVLDVSGSMVGTKMTQARDAGQQLLNTLRPNDRFRLIAFSTDVNSFRDAYVAASRKNINAARTYLDALDAEGSTNIEGALREALRPRPAANRLSLVLFITDGEPTVGERNPDRLAAIADPGVDQDDRHPRLFTFGLGADVNVTLLEQLALGGHGTSQFVRPEESVERSVSIIAHRLMDPVLTDVRIHAEGNVSLSQMLPSAGGDLFAGQDLISFARYSGSGTSRVVIEGRQGGHPVEWSTTVNFPDRTPENRFVARLWAAQRIGYLSAERRRNGGSPELDNEIRALGERFSIPTEFTSYFVAEPNMNLSNGRVIAPRPMGGGRGGASSTAAAPARDAQFEAARMAAVQRTATKATSLDSLSRVRSGGANPDERQVGGRTFHLDGGVWSDIRPAGSRREVTVESYSKAYFDLLKQLPELAPIMGLGDQVTVVGRDLIVNIRTDSGVDALSSAELSDILRDW